MMLSNISKKIYEVLSQDATLTALLPNIKDGTNIWELRMPEPVANNKFPVIVFRIVTATPLLSVESLDALNWFLEIDIINNDTSMTVSHQIFDRIYQLLQSANLSTTTSKVYKCSLDFMTTEYDTRILTTFILSRWQIFSLDAPTTKLSNL